jgi:large subunit ribosomal protein L9
MKVILLSDVKTLGKKGQVVEVAEGYGRNFLLPRKLAAEASKGALAVLESQSKAQEKREAQTLTDARDLAAKVENAKLDVKAKAGGNGKLFGAVTNADVAEAISRSLGVDVDRHKIEIKASIKALGAYPVEIKLHKHVVAKTTVNVVAA